MTVTFGGREGDYQQNSVTQGAIGVTPREEVETLHVKLNGTSQWWS